MGTGKYRITKIPRDWELNGKKITLKRVVRNGEVKYVNEKEKAANITNYYYDKIKTKNNSKFLGTEEQFIFKVNKMKRNIENDCIIMGEYKKEKYEEVQVNFK